MAIDDWELLWVRSLLKHTRFIGWKPTALSLFRSIQSESESEATINHKSWHWPVPHNSICQFIQLFSSALARPPHRFTSPGKIASRMFVPHFNTIQPVQNKR
jgi:hypothetical protein